MSTYSRFDSSDPLEHDVREKLITIVESTPGLTLAQLTRRLEQSESTIRYHTRILEEESLVEKHELFGNVRVYPVALSEREATLIAITHEDSLRPILNAIARHEPTTVSTIATDVDRASSTVSYHLTRLAEAGVIDRKRVGQMVNVSLAPAYRQAVHELVLGQPVAN